MLDIKFIRENCDFVKKATKDKGFDESMIDKLLKVDEKRRDLILKSEKLRAERNELSKSHESSSRGKDLKTELKEVEDDLKMIEEEFNTLMFKVPNPSASDVKLGNADENEVIKKVGELPEFSFNVRDHVDLGLITDTIDLERGAKVAQSGFFYFKNDAVLLELALEQYAFEKLISKGFIPVITPNVAKERNIVGCGFQARSDKERQIYHLEGEDLDLVATAEITLVGMHTDEIIEPSKLPLRYVGLSSCYRKEIGSYGKDVRGILRVHEFKKVEMVVFCDPKDSTKIHEELLAIEEEIYQELGIPYQVVKMTSGDLGNAATKKYDLEAWMPSQNKYREITSASNTTDFQSRRLNIKTKMDGENVFVHTLNGTIVTTSRTVIAIYENFQNEDGSISIPLVLQKWMGKEKINVR
ncbi:MAG: serine--tRNA ligase [Candidatus Woesebacteria bacterium]|nr:serine--tRNA ligase [Candidatus Woesebacteria bacterium]